MATATITIKPVVPQSNSESVTLILSEMEARTLRTICGAVGGDPKRARGHIDRILRALDRVGFDARAYDHYGGSISLSDDAPF